MPVDARDELWNAVYETYYDGYCIELTAEIVTRRWLWIDGTTRIVVALTASSSAISGWALWGKPGWAFAWAILAGVGAILAIFHGTLSVSSKLAGWSDVRRNACQLRVELENVRYRMNGNPKFHVGEISNDFTKSRTRYAEIEASLPHDLLCTDYVRRKAQDELDGLLIGAVTLKETDHGQACD